MRVPLGKTENRSVGVRVGSMVRVPLGKTQNRSGWGAWCMFHWVKLKTGRGGEHGACSFG